MRSGWKGSIQLLAYAGEFYGLARHRRDRERRAAARVAVQLRQHDARDVQRLVEGGGRVHRVLARHRVHDQHDLRRLRRGLDVLELVHELFVYVQAARRVEEDEVAAELLRVGYAGLGYLHGVALAHLEDGDAQLLAHGLQLLYGRRAVHVAGHEQRALALLFHERRQLCAVRRLARALQADEHADARALRGDVELAVLAAHECTELLVDYLHDHLRRGQALHDLRALRALGDALYKVLDDLVAHVRLQQRKAHLAHGLVHVRLGQAALAPELLERGIQFVRKALKSQSDTSVSRPGPEVLP